ncbi:MAG: VIT domain-containing protein [Myxococcota bacterium]
MHRWLTTSVLWLYGLGTLLLLSCRPTVAPLVPRPEVRRAAPARTSAPPSISLTASDGTGLELTHMDAEVVLEDPLAFTELELRFDNPRGETIEGRFQILLPQGAQVTRFATEVEGQLQEAEVVEKQHARLAYEAYLHAELDPALLERDTGNRFRARVFPIEPYESKRVVISYALPMPDPDEPFRLATRGLPWLQALDVQARVFDAQGKSHVWHHALREQAPTRDIVIPRPAADAAGLRHGERVVARFDPLAGADPGEARDFRRLTVLFDTSASRAQTHGDAVDRLERLMGALARHAGTAQLELLAFDQQVVPIYSGPLAGLGPGPLSALRGRPPLGASNLEAALAALEYGERDRVLVVTDGLVSAGADSNAQLRRRLAALARHGVTRLDVLRVGSVRDDARLQALVTGPLPSAGVLLPAQGEAERAAMQMLMPTLDGLRIDVPGATWWHPRTADGLQPGDHLLVHAELPPGQPFTVQISGPLHTEHVVPLREVDSPLLDHAWMHGRVQALLARIETLQNATRSESLRRLAISLSVQHRIFNDLTAFLVLQTDEDYARFGIDRRARAEILVTGQTGVEVLQRKSPAEPEPEPDPSEELDPAPPPERATGNSGISGRVDNSETDAPIPDALVILQCGCLTQGNLEAMTNPRGEYSFGSLPAGDYTVQVLSGKANVSKTVAVPRGARYRANFALDPDADFTRTIAVESKRARRRRVRYERKSAKGNSGSPSASRGVPPPPPTPNLPPPADLPPPPPLPPGLPAANVRPEDSILVHDGQSPRNLPTGSQISRDSTVVVETTTTTTRDSGGITLAGATGVETTYTEKGPYVDDPVFGTLGVSYSYNPGPRPARVLAHLTQVQGKGLRRRPTLYALDVRRSLVERCYFQALQQGRRTRGRLRVELRLDGNGQVTRVGKLRQFGLRDPELLRCVDETLRESVFPVDGVRSPKVVTTLVFQPGDGPPDGHEDEGPEPAPPPDQPPPPQTLTEIDAAIAAGQLRQAWSQAWAWREAAPTDVLALVALGRVAQAMGRTSLAARAYGSILDLYPSRADMRRFAAAQLETLDESALDLAVDAYRKAQQQRPDHPSSHRNLAFALLRQGDPREAFEVLEQGLSGHHPAARFAGAGRVLREDLGIVAAAWLRESPTDAPQVRARLAAQGATLATTPSLRFVLTWETDANDVDLHVVDAEGNDAYHEQPTHPSGGELFADVATGYGPECFAISGPPTGGPYRLWVHYFDRGPMGYGMGRVQVAEHDGEGRVVLHDRTFVILEDGERAELGSIDVAPVAAPAPRPGESPW